MSRGGNIVFGGTYKFADKLNNKLSLIPKNVTSARITVGFKSGSNTFNCMFFDTDENGNLTQLGYINTKDESVPRVGYVYDSVKGWDKQSRNFQTIQIITSDVPQGSSTGGINDEDVDAILASNFSVLGDFSLSKYYFFRLDRIIMDNDYDFIFPFESNGENFNEIKIRISNYRVSQMLFYKADGSGYVTVVHDVDSLTNEKYLRITIKDTGNIYDSQLNLWVFIYLFRHYGARPAVYYFNKIYNDLGDIYGTEFSFYNYGSFLDLYGYYTNELSNSRLIENQRLIFNETSLPTLIKHSNEQFVVSYFSFTGDFSYQLIPFYYLKLKSPNNVKFNSITNILNWDSVKYADKYHLEYPNGKGYTITENQDFLYLNGKYILTAQSDYPFIATSDITEVMVTNYNTNIVFGYYNSSESNRLDKTLSQQFEAACTFRNSVSVLNPVIELEMDELPKINYVYLVALHRYYYVTDITIIRNRLYSLHLAVDVLMSYKDEILNLNPIIERQENYYNNLLVNDHVITQLKYNYSTQTAEGDISFSMTDLDFIITALTSTDAGNPPVTQQQVTLLSPMCGAYLITSKNAFLQFAEGILNPNFWDSVSAMFTNKGEYIYGIKGINFNIKSTTNLPWTGTSSISLGGKSVTGLDSSNVFIVPMGCTPYLEFRFDIPSVIDNNFAFMRTSPYTEYELFLPFVGWITLDADIIFSQNITYLYIIYYIDVVTLNATVVVSKISATGIQPPIKVRGENILYMTNCNVGVDIPWGTTNINEIYKTITTGAVSLAASAASGFVSYKAANSSANALYPASGRRINNDRQISAQRTRISGDASMAHSLIGGLSSTMNNTVLNLRQRFQHGNIGNGVSDTYVASKPVLRVKYPSILIPDNYSSLYGFPCGSTYKLSNLKGFTIVDRVHMDGFPNATLDEIEEIESILKSGVIL